MCGIIGHIRLHNKMENSLFEEMLNTLKHRGPDDLGTYYSNKHHVALGHRRLSFLDLSSAGKQPFCNPDQTVWLTFNGEIYNYLELKKELEKEYSFKTNSDTEVLIAAYEKWGISFVNKLKGMFAFGLYDEQKKKLFLVRDRFGIKPLYFYKDNENIIFASEIKAILASRIPKKEIDFSSFSDYFVYRYIPSPKTIWRGIKKIAPAHYVEVDTESLTNISKEYWDLSSENKSEDNFKIINTIDSILLTSVKEHIRSDVPVGAFLSGGYDSSALVMYMKQLGVVPETFSIGFDNWDKSEDQFARIVAVYLNVTNESVIAGKESLKLVDLMPMVYDEPIADISIVPTYLVSKLAKTKVKAVLSGEGADEIFGGYTWHHDFFALNYPEGVINKLKSKIKPVDTVNFYAQAMAMGWFDKEELEKMLHPDLHQFIPEDVHWFYRQHYRSDLSPLKSIQYLDIKCFMGELVLTKVDRASMANSLEVRVPFLDHSLIEKVFSLNENVYFNKLQTKSLLYENLKGKLPSEILERKKQGFVGPDDYYMDLEYYRRELSNSKLVEYNIINQSYIDGLLKKSYDWKLWKILIMEKWFATWAIDAN